MWRHIASNALSLFVVILVLLGGLIAWGKTEYRAAGPLTEAMCLRVPSGARMTGVSEGLVEQGAISNGTVFRLGADYSDKSEKLKAGSFLVPKGASMVEIVDIITRGGVSTCGVEIVYRIGITKTEMLVRELDPASDRFVIVAAFNPTTEEVPARYTQVRSEADTRYRIALAEGATSWQIFQSLKGLDFIEVDSDNIPDEGSLAPDSYEVLDGSKLSDLIESMQQSQRVRLDEAWANRADNLPLKTPEQALILASIVEKETGLAEERAQVASVFINRLNDGMKLQTDPTVIYGVTNGQGALGRGLRQSELRKETPYNTYVIEGLPPTPIANPGIDALNATLNPDSTDYIFFVANGTGGHTFTTNYSDHRAAVEVLRAIEASRGSD